MKKLKFEKNLKVIIMKTINEKTNTKIPGIYEIINLVNNKKYIGQSVDVRTRLNQHKSYLKHNRHHNSHLQAAYNKYGADNFKFNIIESNLSINSLDSFERYYIKILKTTNSDFGYNLENGGHENKTVSDETKAKIGAVHKGKKISESHKAKISAANKGSNSYVAKWNNILSESGFSIDEVLNLYNNTNIKVNALANKIGFSRASLKRFIAFYNNK
jgi:group I intron endonuclease